MMPIKFRRDDRGAAVIEYAIIGALIGIGLIGALIGTKTSLSAIFGTAASQMGSASTSGGQASAQSRSSYWSAKTIQTNNTVKSMSSYAIITSIAYTDGSTVSLKQSLNGSGVRTGYDYLVVKDAVYNTTTFYYTGPDGSVTAFEKDTYSAMPFSSMNQTLSVVGNYSNGALASVTTSTYNGSSTATSSTTGPATQGNLDDISNSRTDKAYFLTFVPAGL